MSIDAVQEQAETHRFKLDLAYDGTGFAGWAKQPGLRTVQGVLEEAICTILGRPDPAPQLVVAGRTDAGVHAAGQVAHLDLGAELVGSLMRRQRGRHAVAADRTSAEQDVADANETVGALLARRVNGVLGTERDVVVHRAEIAPHGFDARFSAVWRRYRYRVADTVSPKDPLQRRYTAWISSRLDVQAMNRAAASLVGLHDFAAYCKPRAGATTIRTLQRFDWVRNGDGVLVASLQADAFCHSMVRSLVGACVAVGEGRLPEREVIAFLDERVRSIDFKVMPARGLTLTEVGYPEPGLLLTRASETRARRTLPAHGAPASN